MPGPGGVMPLSPRNPRIATLRRLSRRRSARSAAGAFVVEGPTLVAEALRSGLVVQELYAVADGGAAHDDVVAEAAAAGAVCFEVDGAVLAGALDVVTPHALAAVVALPVSGPTSTAELAGRGPVLALDAVADPGNAGTLVRTAEAAGFAGVVVGEGTVDLWSPKVVRAAAGSLFRLAVRTVEDLAGELAAARSAGVRCIGTAAGATPYDAVDLDGPLVVVLGSEAHGLSAAVAAELDEQVGIPMHGAVESLNVAVAGAVLAFEVARRRRDGAEEHRGVP